MINNDNMKVLLFITSYRQLEEYKYFNQFLQRLNVLPNICDIFVYCNNVNISNELLTYFQEFKQQNKRIYITSKNDGYARGGVEALSVAYDMGIFEEYDYVIHLHTDVFITDDTYLMEVLNKNLHNDTVFFITKSVPNDSNFFSFDFFIFKPKLLLNNIFKDEMYTFSKPVEYYFCDVIQKNNINYQFIKRFENDHWYPRRIDENLKLYHEHDLQKVKLLLDSFPKL